MITICCKLFLSFSPTFPKLQIKGKVKSLMDKTVLTKLKEQSFLRQYRHSWHLLLLVARAERCSKIRN